MRKHKSVVAILLAVMMICTFMPTMAFAESNPYDKWGDVVSWSDDYSTGYDVNGTGYSTTKTFISDGGISPEYNGLTMANVASSAYGAAPVSGIGYYFDLNGAVPTFDGSDIASSLSQEQFFTVLANPDYFGLKLKDNVKTGGNAKDAVNVYTNNFSYYFGWNVTIDTSAYEYSTIDWTVDNTFSFPVKFTEKTKMKVGKVGDDPVWTVTVRKEANTSEDAMFYFDKVTDKYSDILTPDCEYSNGVYYDGKAHKLVMKEMSGFSVSYAVYNNKTGKYDPKDEVTVTDVADNPVEVKATVVNTSKASDKTAYTFYLNVWNATPAVIQYVDDSVYKIADKTYLVPEGTTWDAADFVEIAPCANATKADRAAVEANAALFKEYMNDTLTVTAKATLAEPNVYAISVDADSKIDAMTTAEKKAYDKKYEQLFKNFGRKPVNLIKSTKAEVQIGNKLNTEISFTAVPGNLTIKNKKGKLTADKTLQFTAQADNGAEVCYKLVNAPGKVTIDKATGTVTLKKGFKGKNKKITVKAYLKYGNAYSSTESQTITVTVKKSKKK